MLVFYFKYILKESLLSSYLKITEAWRIDCQKRKHLKYKKIKKICSFIIKILN